MCSPRYGQLHHSRISVDNEISCGSQVLQLLAQMGCGSGKKEPAMLQLDPWRRAAECDRAIERVADPERRMVLEKLKSTWVALCSASSLLDDPDRADQFSLMVQIHAELIAGTRTAMH
jgi:hypothetical protein